jgi:cysteine-rich repeat protein
VVGAGGSPAGAGGNGPAGSVGGNGAGGLSINLSGLGGRVGTGGAQGTGGSTKPRVALYCGDGLVNQAKEVCDDGNTVGGDGCTSGCDQGSRA